MLKKEHNDPRAQRIVEQHHADIDGREVLWAISVAGWTFSASKAKIDPGKPAYRATRLSWATILDTGSPGVGTRSLDRDVPVVSMDEAAQKLRAMFLEILQ